MAWEEEGRQCIMVVESPELNAAYKGMNKEPTGYVCAKGGYVPWYEELRGSGGKGTTGW